MHRITGKIKQGDLTETTHVFLFLPMLTRKKASALYVLSRSHLFYWSQWVFLFFSPKPSTLIVTDLQCKTHYVITYTKNLLK